MQWAKQKQPGFTIVELLIVIVVIGILAAITIVAFNGVQQRAKDASARSAASQAGKALAAFAAQNDGQYPTQAEFADATYRTSTLKLPASSASSQYDYRVAQDRSSACVSVSDPTINPTIAYASVSTALVEGRCVENYVTNPSFETSTSGWNWNGNGSGGIGGNVTTPASGFVGSRSVRYNITAPGTMGNFGPYRGVSGLNGTSAYVATAWVRSSKPVTYRILGEVRNSSGTIVSYEYGATKTLVPNVWTPLILAVPPTTNASQMTLCLYGSGPVVSGDFIEWDGVMFTEGTIPAYYRQSSGEDWSWLGATHDSRSVGPAMTRAE